jgi:hypothetical protein
MSTVLRRVNKEIEDFKTKQVQIVPGLFFNQYDNIQNIFFYYNSKFRSGDIDDEGDRKYFLNIVKNPCKVFSKSIDFDTKNIRMLTTGGGDPYKTWFMERDLKYWMRDKQFGKVLNRIFRELPIFGSVVLKIVNGTPYFVDLRNFVVEQSADTLDDSNYIVEIHNYTPASFRKVAKQMKWEKSKVEDTIDLFHKMRDTSHIRLYERYGEVQDEDTMEYTYRRTFIADVGVDEFDQYGNLTATKKGIELSSEEWEGIPYWEFHSEKMPGRWQGIGVVETLIEPQIRENELANLQVKASYWAALRLWQTRDPGANRNKLIDARNGELLTVDSEITQVDMSDRNLSFFKDETQKWLQNRAELTFSYDVVQGERLPAGTPLGSAQLSISQTLSYFEGIQENIALDVKEMLYQVIIPQFQKESSTEHTLRLVGEDLDTYIEMVKNDLVGKEVVKMAVESIRSNRSFPTNADKEAIGLAIEAAIKQGKEKILTVPKNFYDDAKYDIDIDITGESVDTRVRYATRFAILQAITADPTMTTDPVKRKFLYGIAEDGGLNPAELFGTEKKTIADVMGSEAPSPTKGGRAGGGVSAPAMGGDPLGGTTNATL